MPAGMHYRSNEVPGESRTAKTAPLPGVPAVLLVVALVLILIAIPAAGQADNTTVTATQSAAQTTTSTTAPTSNQTTSGTTGTTTVPTSAQTTSGTTVQTILASSAPVAAVAWFDAEPLYGTAPLGVQFTDTSTVTPTSWEWFFGDGTTAYVQNPYHIYTEPGTYSVSMNTVIGGMSYTAIRNDLIEVRTAETTATTTATTRTTTTTTSVTTTSATGSGVEAAFFGAPRRGAAPLTVTFMDASTGSPESWQWDFGDGETSTLANPSHTYTETGSYTVTLTVTRGGASDEMRLPNYVTVAAPTSPVSTQTTAPVSATGTTRAPGTGPTLSPESTTPVPSGGDLGWLPGYILAIAVIAIIAGIAVIVYRRHNRYDLLK